MTKRFFAALLLVSLVACAGGLKGVKEDFRAGRLPEAKAKLVSLERESWDWSGPRRAEYALYRGLVHHALGDRALASYWLTEAKKFDEAYPGALDEDDKTRLRLALESLEGAAQGEPAK